MGLRPTLLSGYLRDRWGTLEVEILATFITDKFGEAHDVEPVAIRLAALGRKIAARKINRAQTFDDLHDLNADVEENDTQYVRPLMARIYQLQIERNCVELQMEMLTYLLTEKFGPTPDADEIVAELIRGGLNRTIDEILKAESTDELREWLC